MAITWRQRYRRLRYRVIKLRDIPLGYLAVLLLKIVRRTDPWRMSDFAGAFMRRFGPWLSEHKIGRANLAAAFPEKSPAEIEAILGGVWENLGRVGVEFAHLDHLWDNDPEHPGEGHIKFSQETLDRFVKLRDDGKPALFFAAHIGNWEMPAIPGAVHGLPSAVIYRTPNLRAIADAVRDIRAVNMGELINTDRSAPIKAANALERGLHVGMLVDQFDWRGVPVTFFGRPTKANPLIARLARLIDCPIHGTRAVRLPGHCYYIECTEEIQPRRDAQGQVDVQGTMQVITDIVEGWVREYPEQWLWVHRRWR